MKTRFIMIAAATCLAGAPAAADTSSNARLEAARSAAASRYADDKKLCTEESSSSTRMQCLRDAKAEYDSALARAGKEHEQPTSSRTCTGCGKVLSVKVVEKAGESGAVGMVAGGVAGALLGNQIGKGASRDIATIAGAAGGAYAGHKIEQQVKSVKKWEVTVRFDQGEEKTFIFDKDPGFASGAAVKSSGSSIVPR